MNMPQNYYLNVIFFHSIEIQNEHILAHSLANNKVNQKREYL